MSTLREQVDYMKNERLPQYEEWLHNGVVKDHQDCRLCEIAVRCDNCIIDSEKTCGNMASTFARHTVEGRSTEATREEVHVWYLELIRRINLSLVRAGFPSELKSKTLKELT